MGVDWNGFSLIRVRVVISKCVFFVPALVHIIFGVLPICCWIVWDFLIGNPTACHLIFLTQLFLDIFGPLVLQFVKDWVFMLFCY